MDRIGYILKKGKKQMGNKIKTLLDKEIERQIENLPQTDEGNLRTEAINDLTKLHKLRIDEAKLDTEIEEKSIRREFDERKFEREIEEKSIRRELDERKLDSEIEGRINDETLKRNQERAEHKNRYYRYGLEAAGIVLPLVFYGIWMHKGFKFEETGSFTSTTFRGLFNRFRPTDRI